MAAKEKETKVIKTAALKLGALDKTLFAARGGLKRRKKKLQKLAKQFEIIFKATHESRPPSSPSTHAPHDLRFMRHLTRVAAQVESSLCLFLHLSLSRFAQVPKLNFHMQEQVAPPSDWQ